MLLTLNQSFISSVQILNKQNWPKQCQPKSAYTQIWDII